jgi:hypothetical protein
VLLTPLARRAVGLAVAGRDDQLRRPAAVAHRKADLPRQSCFRQPKIAFDTFQEKRQFWKNVAVRQAKLLARFAKLFGQDRQRN